MASIYKRYISSIPFAVGFWRTKGRFNRSVSWHIYQSRHSLQSQGQKQNDGTKDNLNLSRPVVPPRPRGATQRISCCFCAPKISRFTASATGSRSTEAWHGPELWSYKNCGQSGKLEIETGWLAELATSDG